MSDGVFVSDEQIYCAVFGSMITRQVMDRMESGRGAPTDEDMDGFAEEANSVALMTIEAAARCRRASEICEWCDEPVANGKTHGEGKCFAFDDEGGEP
jgi:hypothetical protein